MALLKPVGPFCAAGIESGACWLMVPDHAIANVEVPAISTSAGKVRLVFGDPNYISANGAALFYQRRRVWCLS
jgi:hypothetical protein